LHQFTKQVYDFEMVVGELTGLAESIGDLARSDLNALANCDAIRDLFRLRDQLDAVAAKAAAAFDAGGDWHCTGAKTAASWISILCNQPLPRAKTVLRLGRALRDMQIVADAWSGGRSPRPMSQCWPRPAPR
jgi:hypothetical protein